MNSQLLRSIFLNNERSFRERKMNNANLGGWSGRESLAVVCPGYGRGRIRRGEFRCELDRVTLKNHFHHTNEDKLRSETVENIESKPSE